MVDRIRGKIVATGVWLYDGSLPRTVEIQASNYDYTYEEALEEYEDALAVGQEDEVRKPEAPRSLGPDGWLYKVDGWGGGLFESLDAAMAWANARPWGPVTWAPCLGGKDPGVAS